MNKTAFAFETDGRRPSFGRLALLLLVGAAIAAGAPVGK
jgi:hypothetical protein